MERSSVVVDGVEFAYLASGPRDGALALCLHGFPDHAPTFEPLLGALGAKGFRAVAPWMRGYHPTAVPADGVYHTSRLALDALGIADALADDGAAVLVGHDWGAACAYAAAAMRPERFERLVTMALPPLQALGARFFANPVQLKRSWYMFFFQSPLAEMAVQAGDFAFIEMLWRDWSPGYTPPAAFMRELKATLAVPGGLAAALGYYRAMLGGTPDPAPEELRGAARRPVAVPALYMHGRDDGCIGADLVVADELRPHFPGGLEVEFVDGAGHFLHLERPDEVNARIAAFLRG